MPRDFRIITEGKTTIYTGFDRKVRADTEHIALVEDEDSVEVLAVEDVCKLDGVVAYVDDQPHNVLLGIWTRRHSANCVHPVSNERLAHLLSVSAARGTRINEHLQQHLGQVAYNTLIDLLS